MARKPLPYVCAMLGVEMGRHIRNAIHALTPTERSRTGTSILKPKAPAPVPDVVGEQIAIEFFTRLSRMTGHTVNLIIDPATAAYKPIGEGDATIWAYLDACDGTIKVSGLANEGDTLCGANDGNWGVGVAFTAPTKKSLDALVLGDFWAAAIVDGNPTVYQIYPRDTAAYPDPSGVLRTYDVTETRVPVITTSCVNISKTFVYLDTFQAFDRASAGPRYEAIASKLHNSLMDRNKGGAFDLLRTYGNLAALNKNMLGWSEMEPQCGGYLVVNENLPNMIPAVPIILGAGGKATDFNSNDLSRHRLVNGRSSVVYAGNPVLHQQLMAHVRAAKGI